MDDETEPTPGIGHNGGPAIDDTEPSDTTAIAAEQPETLPNGAPILNTPLTDAVSQVTAAGADPHADVTAHDLKQADADAAPENVKTALAATNGVQYQGKRMLRKILEEIAGIGEDILHNAEKDVLWTEQEIKDLIRKIHSEL